MTLQELFDTLKFKFREIVDKHDLLKSPLVITCRALSSQEAIGETIRKDYPLLNGKDIMVQAAFEGGLGQVFTDSPVEFKGLVEDVLALDAANNSHDRTIFIATLNAVMNKLNMINRTVHCKGEVPENCARSIGNWVESSFNHPKIAQVGYQPALLSNLASRFEVRILDLNPEVIGTVKSGVKVLDGVKDFRETVDWSNIILCTGSVLSNGTIVNFLNLDKQVYFYGITIAGAAQLLGLNRLCYADL